MNRLLLASLLFLIPSASALAEDPPLSKVERVLFLGDSITYAGQYAEHVEACLRVKDPKLRCEFVGVGLPSETVSGLSEPGHAGGAFPRPQLRERLDRVLAKTKPDLVVACYGMNDGMYYPFSEDRFAKYREGMEHLRQRADAVGAKVLHVTPPVFDPVPIKASTLPAGRDEYRQPYEGYNDVLDRYSAWLVSQRENGWEVVDIHTPMNRYLADARKRDPKFRLADDGVHIDAAGHWLIAREILKHWGIPDAELADVKDAESFVKAHPNGAEILKLVGQKQRMLKDALLTSTGHKRPGMGKGLPIEEAEKKARELDAEIGKKLAEKR